MVTVLIVVAVFGYILWYNERCLLDNYREEVAKAIKDINLAMPVATHSVTEVKTILHRLEKYDSALYR